MENKNKFHIPEQDTIPFLIIKLANLSVSPVATTQKDCFARS